MNELNLSVPYHHKNGHVQYGRHFLFYMLKTTNHNLKKNIRFFSLIVHYTFFEKYLGLHAYCSCDRQTNARV